MKQTYGDTPFIKDAPESAKSKIMHIQPGLAARTVRRLPAAEEALTGLTHAARIFVPTSYKCHRLRRRTATGARALPE